MYIYAYVLDEPASHQPEDAAFEIAELAEPPEAGASFWDKCSEEPPLVVAVPRSPIRLNEGVGSPNMI